MEGSSFASSLLPCLPLQLIKSQIIPPAPSRSQRGSEPIADFLFEFCGLSWIAYGASFTVVISHFPNPMSEAETKVGPIFRQVIELYREGESHVSALAWSPATPSVGELAVALSDCIVLLRYGEDKTSSSSFCWAQTSILKQSTEAETIRWTGSGDGIISGGIEVVLWRRRELWEKAWSFKPEVPQALVSACWSANELLATAPRKHKLPVDASDSAICKARKSVLIFEGNRYSEYPRAKLEHPMPVTLIQWRPSSGKTSSRHAGHTLRAVLLTCCIDGAARLWSEVDNGKVQNTRKANADHKSTKPSFFVVALIELNQVLNGYLGSDLILRWGTEVEGVIFDAGEACYHSFLDHSLEDTAGTCEWVIGLGPKGVAVLWAIHCLDDLAPLRFPRVTLWKKLSFLNFEEKPSYEAGLLVSDMVVMRNQVSGPPLLCSFLQLSPSNFFSWSQLYSLASSSLEGKTTSKYPKETTLTACALGELDGDGHTGKILEVAIHPFFEVQRAASLDGNGIVFFWSFSSFFNSCIGLPTSTPFWKVCGKAYVSDHSSKYNCLNWAPAVFGNDLFLLMGHETGVDCFLFESLKDDGGKISFHNLFSIPFGIEGCRLGPNKVCSIPLPPNCLGNFISSRFLVVAIWMDDFLAISWEIIIHRHELEDDHCDGHPQTFESRFSCKKYSISMQTCCSSLPVPHNDDNIISCDVVCPSDLMFSLQQKVNSVDDLGSRCYAYHLITGCTFGSIKLWRSISPRYVSSSDDWSLIGIVTHGNGPVMALSPSPCFQRIAAASVSSHPGHHTEVCIWECVHVRSVGGFIQEEKLCFDGNVIAIKWLKLGNGQLLLAVCLQNEFRVYTSRRRSYLGILKCDKHLEEMAWICIAVTNVSPSISDFLWGPKGSVIILHGGYLSLFSQFMLSADGSTSNRDICLPGFVDFIESPVSGLRRCQLKSSLKLNYEFDLNSVKNVESSQWMYDPAAKLCFWSLSQIAEKTAGCLPLFHPDVLLLNLYTGNWKRALIALRHLTENLDHYIVNKRGHISSTMHFPVSLSSYLEGNPSLTSSNKVCRTSTSQFQTGLSFFTPVPHDKGPSSLASSSLRSEFDGFVSDFKQLYDYKHINEVEKRKAFAIINVLLEVSNPDSPSAYESLDEFGRRFWVATRFQKLCFDHIYNLPLQAEELFVSSTLINWAFHSDCHDILFNSVLSKESSWEEMRSMGVGFWYTNVAELRVKIEVLARQRYLKSKDPRACALLYIALNRVQVLAGLFKISKDDKDKVLAGFLSRNFQEDKNKAAALKNAYVLMGKHDLELAIAFFLLGGDASSAVTVCARSLGDEQLALVISRLIEGCGGPLERSLISKFLLPSALLKGDLWMASLLEWTLGNYYQSFVRLLGVQTISEVYLSMPSSCHASFLDPIISQFCLMLSLKPCMKSAIGEFSASVLCQLTILMNASSLAKCGLPLEALECLSSSASLFNLPAHGKVMHSPTSNLVELVNPDEIRNSSNWISDEFSSYVIFHRKLCLAVQHIIQWLRMHPSCMNAHGSCFGDYKEQEIYNQAFEKSLEEFQDNFMAAITYLQQKFSIAPHSIIEMLILHTHQNGLEFIGLYIMEDFIQKYLGKESETTFAMFMCPSKLLKATEEFSCLFEKYVFLSCKSSSNLEYLSMDYLASEGRPYCLAAWGFCNQGIAYAFWHVKAMSQLFLCSYSKDCLLLFNILDLFLCLMLFALAWLMGNSRALLLTVRPILTALTKGDTAYEMQMKDSLELLSQVMQMLTQDFHVDGLGIQVDIDGQKPAQIEASPNDLIWHVTHSSFWKHVSDFLTDQVCRFSVTADTSCSPQSLEQDSDKHILVGSISNSLIDFLKINCANVSFYGSKLFAICLLHKLNISGISSLLPLEDFLVPPEAAGSCKIGETIKWLDHDDTLLGWLPLLHMFMDPKVIHGDILQEYRIWLRIFKQKPTTRWIDSYVNIGRQLESEGNWDKEDRLSSSNYAGGSPIACLSPNNHPFKSSADKDLFDLKKVLPLQNPNEIYRRNGELLEALCINSIDHCQAAIASNRKGIVFFNWDDGLLHGDKTQCIWGETEWPHNGWAGSEPVPVPTYVSPSVGLGSKEGAELGLGGAAIVAGTSGWDVTGSGSFGIPGYAGIGVSSLSWGIQDGFEEFLDPPATVDNVKTRAFASHPSRPFFMVGSSNTHTYLWEFGKDKATATYGILPAANVPPPYALASVAAVRFDDYGHRFVTAALDGTVRTWQLEVGGRSNIPPTEISVCFSNYTSDVTYVTRSGSIVAAAGYSSNGVNIVVWDSLAPPATSQASIMCHEGGARSVGTLDNEIGSSSMCPLIISGGKSGDVGVHDFRYIASGRRKKEGDEMRNKTGDQNRNGMLWYIPKAHSASVTRISTIPNTSLFLTGSKDGDVKLWDAKRAKLVFHWAKLHERHTFLQPSSRGFGGVVRAGVTDIVVVSGGFLTCGGDGLVKFISLPSRDE